MAQFLDQAEQESEGQLILAGAGSWAKIWQLSVVHRSFGPGFSMNLGHS